jgi:hypothetical protein
MTEPRPEMYLAAIQEIMPLAVDWAYENFDYTEAGEQQIECGRQLLIILRKHGIPTDRPERLLVYGQNSERRHTGPTQRAEPLPGRPVPTQQKGV